MDHETILRILHRLFELEKAHVFAGGEALPALIGLSDGPHTRGGVRVHYTDGTLHFDLLPARELDAEGVADVLWAPDCSMDALAQYVLENLHEAATGVVIGFAGKRPDIYEIVWGEAPPCGS